MQNSKFYRLDKIALLKVGHSYTSVQCVWLRKSIKCATLCNSDIFDIWGPDMFCVDKSFQCSNREICNVAFFWYFWHLMPWHVECCIILNLFVALTWVLISLTRCSNAWKWIQTACAFQNNKIPKKNDNKNTRKTENSLQNWGTENLTLSGGFDEMCIEYVLHIHTRLSLQDGTL